MTVPPEPDAKDTPADSPEEELPPHKLEAARSSRSRCRTCRRSIDKGKLRLGVLLEGPYGTGYLWHHLTCAARRRPDDVEAAYEERAWDEGLEVPPLEELRALREKAERERSQRREPPYVERAPSARSRCKHCGEAIEKDAFRFVLAREVTFGQQTRSTPINVHPRCVSAELLGEDCATEAEDIVAALEANSQLAPDELAAAIAEAGGLD